MGLRLAAFQGAREAALALRAGRGTYYIGGGTFLLRRVNEGDASIETLVRVADPALAAITITADRVTLGASVPMAAIAVRSELGALARAAKTIGGPAVRDMATVGGNLFAPNPYGDLGVALLALEAGVTIESGAGPEEIPLESFYARRGRLLAGSIVTAVSFARAGLSHLRFVKVSRVKPKGSAVLSIAAVVVEQGGVVSSAAIALGCMAEAPMRACAAEAALRGRALTREGMAPALALASEGTAPPTDAIASAWYRRAVLAVYLGRLLGG